VTTVDHILRHAIPAAFDLLPEKMRSPHATAMIIAIGLQESRFQHRRQVRGPARGFFQFEQGGGVVGVLRHPSTTEHARAALEVLCYPRSATSLEVYQAIEDNDTLACVFARLLLWTLPDALPGSDESDEGWRQYLNAWRPGKPHQSTWHAHYTHAWTLVNSL
jgi:hypothetical protein